MHALKVLLLILFCLDLFSVMLLVKFGCLKLGWKLWRHGCRGMHSDVVVTVLVPDRNRGGVEKDTEFPPLFCPRPCMFRTCWSTPRDPNLGWLAPPVIAIIIIIIIII